MIIKIRKYFLCVILLLCPIVHGNSLWQNLVDTSSSYARYWVCFAHYTKDNPLFAVSMVAAISGMTACFAKFVFYTQERKNLEQQNPELNKIVVATEQWCDKKQKLLGHNWNVSVNYEKLYKNALDNESDLYKSLMSLCARQTRSLYASFFFLFGMFGLIGKAGRDIEAAYS